jgi:hypothetical protein
MSVTRRTDAMSSHPYPWQRVSAQRETGDLMIGCGHFQVTGLGRRVPGSGVQVRVQVQGLNFYPVPAPVPDNPYQGPEGRDLRPEDASHVCTKDSTWCCPYLCQVLAVSGWRLGTQQDSYVVTRSRPYLKAERRYAKGNRMIGCGHFQVTCLGRRGIGLSGVGRSAFGSRLQMPAADARDAEA